jgi:hypothetical protein
LDQLGTTRALTTLSPILPDRMRELTTRLKVVRYTPGIGRPLMQLAFVHYARWIILDWLPPARGNGGWHGLRWKYLLFESNYDGSEADYLRTFADIVPARLAKLWGTCFGFETATGSTPRAAESMLPAGGFRAFVERNQLEVLAFYAAYPDSTTTDVRQAIALHALASEIASADGEESMHRIGNIEATALGPIAPRLSAGQRLRAVLDPWASALRGRYGVNPLSILTPLTEGQEERLRGACADPRFLEGLTNTETHFARLVIIPRHMADLGQPDADVVETPYLLFTSDAWGSAFDQIEAIRRALSDAADVMWDGCNGYPGHDERNATRFHAWVNTHALRTSYYVAGYPPYPASTIKLRLRERERIARTYALERDPELTQLLAEAEPDRD